MRRHRKRIAMAAAAVVAAGSIALASQQEPRGRPRCERTSTCQTTTTTVPGATTTTAVPATTTTTVSGGACTGVAVSTTTDLKAAFDAQPSAATFCISTGIHRITRSATPKSGSTIIGAPGAILSGAAKITTFGRSGAYWTITGQTQEFPILTNVCEPTTYIGCRYSDGVFVDNQPLWQVTALFELSAGEFFFDRATDTIYLFNDPTGHNVEVTVATAAIAGYGGTTGQQNVTIRGLIVEKFAQSQFNGEVAPIKAGWNWTIESNEIRLNAGAGVAVNNGTVLRNNSIHHNGQYGFSGGPLTGLTVEGNDIGFNNTSSFSHNDDAGGSKIVRGTNLVFRNNVVHDNKGPGLWADWDNVNVTYEGNRIERNSAAGIFHEASPGGVIRNNILSGNGTFYQGRSIWNTADIFLNDSRDTEIYGNIITAGVHGIGLVDTDRGSTALGLLEIRNVYVHDNTVRLPAGGRVGLVGRTTAFSANNRFEHNTYQVLDVSGIWWEWNGSRTWSSWRSVGHDQTGTVTT